MQKYYDHLCVIGDLILDNPIDGEQAEGEMRFRSENGGVSINGDKIITESSQIQWTKITGVPEFTVTSLDWSKLSNIPTQVTDLTQGMYVEAMAMASPFGIATLDSNGKLSPDQIPSTIVPLGYTALNKAGDSILGSLSFPKTAGIGIKVENQYGWKDLIGDVSPKYGSGAAPAQALFLPSIRAWAYSANDQFDCVFHIPHDYAPGTDLFLHMHWAHNGTNITGTFNVDMYVTYAKGYGQAAFSPAKNVPITVTGLTIQNTPQHIHRIDEVQLSISGGSSNMLNTSLIEVDGLIIISGIVSTLPSISGSVSSNRPFIFTVDVHYQSTGLTTKNKSPNFYG